MRFQNSAGERSVTDGSEIPATLRSVEGGKGGIDGVVEAGIVTFFERSLEDVVEESEFAGQRGPNSGIRQRPRMSASTGIARKL